MAARLVKRAKVFGLFPRRSCLKMLSIATASSAEGHSPDEERETRTKKVKDEAKMAAYDEYRSGVRSMRDGFKQEYKRMKVKEWRRWDEINKGRFSPIEQHKKAVEDITRYNENKENARKLSDEQKTKRREVLSAKQKEDNDAKQLAKNRELVLQIIEESKSFVTFENLEAKIEEVLSTETNYNFAITVEGRQTQSKEPPSNLGTQGPGPLAYQGQRSLTSFDNRDSWKNRNALADNSDSSDSDSSDSDSSDSDFTSDDEK